MAGSTTEVIRAVASLVSAIAWPLAIVIIVGHFRRPIAKFLNNMAEVHIKGGGVDFTAKRAEASAALSAAEASHPEAGDGGAISPAHIADTVTKATDRATIQRLEGTRVLWVDDHPENNRFERQALEALGVAFDLATSTAEALNNVRLPSYAAIISDLSRKSDAEDDPEAGFTLLSKIRDAGIRVPFIVYAGRNGLARREELIRAGVFGVTNQPRELFDLVVTAIKAS